MDDGNTDGDGFFRQGLSVLRDTAANFYAYGRKVVALPFTLAMTILFVGVVVSWAVLILMLVGLILVALVTYLVAFFVFMLLWSTAAHIAGGDTKERYLKAVDQLKEI